MLVRKIRSKKLLYILIIVLLATSMTGVCLFNSPTKPQPVPENPLYLDVTLSIDARVNNLLSYMTLEEKIGQMTLVEKNSLNKISDISTYSLGALLSGSGAKPEVNTVSGWKEMITTYQSEATKSRLGIPLLYGSDAIHGHAHVPGATVFPHLIALGATGNPELVKAVAMATAEEMADTGVNWNFAPNLDIPQDIRWGRVYETFSDDPDLVAKLGSNYIEGLQTPEATSAKNIRILASVKHFIGLGAMEWDSSLNKNFKIDQGVTLANDELLKSVYLPPFISAIDAGALNIMIGLNTWGNNRTVRQKHLLTDLLKEELGFKGFIVSDWYGVHEGTYNTFFATVRAVNAGVDMVMLPFDYKTFSQHMKLANRLNLISDERIDDAVRRILIAKFAMGLFDKNNQVSEIQTVGSNEHRALARDSVAKSLVLLKNDNDLLPIKKNATIKVAGSAADNIGKQAGAWTVEWQGIDGNWLLGATSILSGIQEVTGDNSKIEYSQDGEFPKNTPVSDIGIAIVGESPYAEGWGDNIRPSLSDEDLKTIENLKKVSKKVIVVLVTGRPLIITDEIENWDAVVVAWLPGSEGAGVADVLFGDKLFTGSLPLPWPASINQIPIALNGKTTDGSDVLFPRYFGLRY